MNKKETRTLVKGCLLRQLRNIYEYSMADMREKLGISMSYLSSIERGKSAAGYTVISRYAEIFGIKCSQLVALSENYPGEEIFAKRFISVLISEIWAKKGKCDD